MSVPTPSILSVLLTTMAPFLENTQRVTNAQKDE